MKGAAFSKFSCLYLLIVRMHHSAPFYLHHRIQGSKAARHEGGGGGGGGVRRALRLIRHYEFVESYHVLEKRSLGLASGDLVIFKNSGMINR